MFISIAQVRFQHEVYPDDRPQQSRQVLLITEMEIRDRLAQSEINKLMYLLTSHDLPRQSHAYMVNKHYYYTLAFDKNIHGQNCRKD
jgi:autophagy-related protein 2